MDESVADHQFDEAAFDRKWPAEEYEIITDTTTIKLEKKLGVVVRLNLGKSIVKGPGSKFFLPMPLPAGCSMSELTDAADQHLGTLKWRRKPCAVVTSTSAPLMIRERPQSLEPTPDDADGLIAESLKGIATTNLVKLAPDTGEWPLQKALFRVALKIVKRQPRSRAGRPRTEPRAAPPAPDRFAVALLLDVVVEAEKVPAEKRARQGEPDAEEASRRLVGKQAKTSKATTPPSSVTVRVGASVATGRNDALTVAATGWLVTFDLPVPPLTMGSADDFHVVTVELVSPRFSITYFKLKALEAVIKQNSLLAKTAAGGLERAAITRCRGVGLWPPAGH